ncbi:sigma-70 family RNA polymerase sigma factor [Rheinheimera mangrovi]|uniref:sigma-70 family RNA polymerase sigma factor n=1 Tax=Rheinheimera mangrovi TaxID=2498451 RepID=UPI0019816DDF|nr:sigma-70 family RNA polymerase sigma factor [Rheinheimera mangrovi]
MLLSWLIRRDTAPEPDPMSLMQSYIQTDNPAYLALLIHRYGDDLYHFLLKQTDPALAADLSQQSWLKVMEQKQQFAGHSSFKTWLFAIGRHLLLDEYRKQQRWLYEVNDELAAEDSSPEQVLEQQQKELQLQQLLLLLPLLQREALLLQLEGFSLQQIAQITVTEPETVKSRLRYARQALAKQLGGHDE